MGCNFSQEDFQRYPRCVECNDLLKFNSKTGKCNRCHPMEKVEWNSLVGGRCNECGEKFMMEGNKKFCNSKCRLSFVDSHRCRTCLTRLFWGKCVNCNSESPKIFTKEELATMAFTKLCKYCSNVLSITYDYCQGTNCRSLHERQYYFPGRCPEPDCNERVYTPQGGPCSQCKYKKTLKARNPSPTPSYSRPQPPVMKKKKKVYVMRNGRCIKKYSKN